MAGTSPLTGKTIGAGQLRTNQTLQAEIHAFLQHYRDDTIHFEYVRTYVDTLGCILRRQGAK